MWNFVVAAASDSAWVDSVSRKGELFSIRRPAKVEEWRKPVR
jgi:hypothetical protein